MATMFSVICLPRIKLKIRRFIINYTCTCSLQGDEMILECVYNSANRNVTTFVSKLLLVSHIDEAILQGLLLQYLLLQYNYTIQYA